MNTIALQRICFFLYVALLTSCGTAKHSNQKLWEKPTSTPSLSHELKSLHSSFKNKNSSDVQKLLRDAKKYLGTPYKLAGRDEKGFDCSGLVCKVFQENNILLPRSSSEQAKMGKHISIENTKPGDLLFFATSGGDRVSHVGVIYEIAQNGEIIFLHSSTSKGVITSSLNEKYWNKAFLFARRIIEG